MADHDDLLRRHQPALRYDSMEQYFCDSAAEWTDNAVNELLRADSATVAGAVIARPPQLALGFLGGQRYADGSEVRADDRIGDLGRDYREQYVGLRAARPDLRNRMYAHGVEANGRLWLQYWFFYFYNDYNLALGIGLHEGDWEMVQLRMHDAEPDLAVYAQHGRAELRPWAQVEKVPDDSNRPMVYVARGSHASYFEPGYHQTEAWYDLADGKRRAPRCALEVVGDDSPGWIAWPGVWGGTRARLGGIDQPSPRGPAAHGQWLDPNSLLTTAWEPERRAAIAAPAVSITREQGLMRIDFDFARNRTPPTPPATALQVTVNSRDEPQLPPRAYTFGIAEARSGTLRTTIALDPAKHYDVYTSTTAGAPQIPSASTLTLINPAGPAARMPLMESAIGGLGRLVARLRGQRGR
jgi:Vacuolar protein sorting-associated protein 62